MPIVLPSATSATPMIEEPKELIVDIDADGQFYVDSAITDETALETALTRAVANNPARQSVVIRADHRTMFQAVVTVMDVCNRTGVADYTVTTREGPGTY